MRVGVDRGMDEMAGTHRSKDLPAGVRPLELNIERLAYAVLLGATAVATVAQFPRAPEVLLSTLVIAVVLIRWALGATNKKRLVAWCLLGGSAAGWVNAAVGGALVMGIQVLPFTFIYGFFGLPHGLVYGVGFLLLLGPLFSLRAEPSAGVAERALGMAGLWLAGAGVLVGIVPPYWGGDLGEHSILVNPLHWRMAGALALTAIGLSLLIYARSRLARRQRWIHSVKHGHEPGWCTIPAGTQHGDLVWLTAPAASALVVSRRIDPEGFYRSGGSRPVARIADG
jgi:hypothetical protein